MQFIGKLSIIRGKKIFLLFASIKVLDHNVKTSKNIPSFNSDAYLASCNIYKESNKSIGSSWSREKEKSTITITEQPHYDPYLYSSSTDNTH